MMKKHLSVIVLALLIALTPCCHKEIWKEIDVMKEKLESLQAAQNAYEKRLFVSAIIKNEDGYTIVFSDGSSANVANGKNGKDGKDGADGKDGTDGKDGEIIIESITVDELSVTFYLTNGASFTIPRYSALSLHFDYDITGIIPNTEVTIGFSVKSNIMPVTVETLSSSDIQTKVVFDEGKLEGAIHMKFSSTIDEYSKVIVIASNGENMVMQTLHFEEGGLIINSPNTLHFPAEGGSEVISFQTNLPYEIIIPDDAKEWISETSTKSMTDYSFSISVSPNRSYDDRISEVLIMAKNSNLIESVKIYQSSIKGLILSNDMTFVNSSASDCSVSILANEQYKLSIPDSVSWIHDVVSTKALTPSSALFHVDQNDNDVIRQAIINIESESGLREKYNVTQFGRNASFFSIKVESSEFSFPEIGSDKTNDVEMAGIRWGDGKEEYYTRGITHQFDNNGEKTIEVISSPVYSIRIIHIDGLKEIDLSNL